MGNPRAFTTKFNARIPELQSALRANGITKAKRKRMMERAASSRSPNLAAEAKVSIALRRIAGVLRPSEFEGNAR